MIDGIYLSRFHGGWRCTIWSKRAQLSDAVSKAWWGAVWIAYREALAKLDKE